MMKKAEAIKIIESAKERHSEKAKLPEEKSLYHQGVADMAQWALDLLDSIETSDSRD